MPILSEGEVLFILIKLGLELMRWCSWWGCLLQKPGKVRSTKGGCVKVGGENQPNQVIL